MKDMLIAYYKKEEKKRKKKERWLLFSVFHLIFKNDRYTYIFNSSNIYSFTFETRELEYFIGCTKV